MFDPAGSRRDLRPVRLPTADELSHHYAAAFLELGDDPEDDAWDAAVGDGLSPN